MKTTFHRLRTSDDLELDGLFYEPDQKTDTVLVHIHGMAGNFYENKFLNFLAKTLTDNNIALTIFNNRGTEFFKDLRKYNGEDYSFVRIGSAYEKFEDCLLDISAPIDFVSKLGFKDIHLSGHSLGSPKIVYYMYETNDERIKTLLLLSPSDMIGLAMQNKKYTENMKVAQELTNNGRGKELMPGLIWESYPLSADTYINLSKEGEKVGVLNFYNPSDKLVALSSINKPIIAIMGTKDDAATLPVSDLMNRIKICATSSPKVETNILGKADHGYKNYEQALADVVTNWIKSN